MRAVGFEADGSVRVRDLRCPAPGAGEVLVAVEVAGLNPTDEYHRQRVAAGSDEIARIPGVEVAGKVTALGADVTRWSIGDHVFGLTHDGGLGEFVAADADLLMPWPSGLPARDAAAIPEVFITAHDGLCQGRLAQGDTLLVTGASGAVGTAAVQIGLQMGVRVIAVARSQAGRDWLEQLGAEAFPDHADMARDQLPFCDEVDVVIELVGARNMRSNLAALRPRGRVVFVAAQGDEDVCFNLREFKTKRATVIGSTLRRRGRPDKVAAVRAFEQSGLPLVASGKLRATVGHVVPIAAAPEAFAMLVAAGRIGKVLIDFSL